LIRKWIWVNQLWLNIKEWFKLNLSLREDRELFLPPFRHRKATSIHFTSDFVIGWQDLSVWGVWEAGFSVHAVPDMRPEWVNYSLAEEASSELLIVVVCDHCLVDLHAVIT